MCHTLLCILCDSLKQKEGDGKKAGEFNASKGCFGNFRKKFGFSCQDDRPEAAQQEAAGEFPDAAKKIVEEKGHWPAQASNADGSALSWEKRPQRTWVSAEEKQLAPAREAGRDS